MGVDERALYRAEEGKACIDLHVRSAEQLFDWRDPAPFRQRDLDASAAEYIYSTALDIPFKTSLKLVLWVEQPLGETLTVNTIEAAVRAHFDHDADRARRRLAQQRRFGRLALAGGVTILVAFLSLAEILRPWTARHPGDILRQGLVIAGWVALWRPIEVLLYDWWPLAEERKQSERLARAPIEVRLS
jgi:hypothetical protein